MRLRAVKWRKGALVIALLVARRNRDREQAGESCPHPPPHTHHGTSRAGSRHRIGGGMCPPKCPDCPTKHDAMQNSHIQKCLELEFSMYSFF